MPVDIQASFTKKEKPRNGLENIIKELTEDPLARRFIVGVIECPTTKVDNRNGGALTPVVSLVYVEPMLSDVDVAAAKALFEGAYAARNGDLPEDELAYPGVAEDGEKA